MKSIFKNPKLITALVALAAIICFVLYFPFRGMAQPALGQLQNLQDTTRRKSVSPGNTLKSANEIKQELDAAMLKLDADLLRLKTNDMPKMQEEMTKAWKEAAAAKLKLAEAALQAKLNQKQVDAAMKQAMKELDLAGLHQQVHALAAAKMVNADKLAKEMEAMKLDMAGIKLQAQKQMELAGEQMKLGLAQLQHTKEGIEQLEKDGRVKKGDPLNIEWVDGLLKLNGVLQSKEVSEKYRRYFGDAQQLKKARAGHIEL